MTDHDALARRIAEDIMTACRGGPEERAIRLDLIGLDGRRLGAWAIYALARRIAEHLREALPTSEEAEDALRDIACYVGAGGYNSAEVNVAQMAAKIKASFDDVHRQLMESQ